MSNLCRATQRVEAKLLPSCLWSGRIQVLLGMQERQEAACSVQATATAGRREEDGGSLGGRRGDKGGRRHNNSGGEVWRRRIVRVCWRHSSGSASSGSPATKRTASLRRSCPHWAPAARGAAPPARGHPAAALGPRVMGYLGVGLLSLPLQEPELLLLLSEEVP